MICDLFRYMFSTVCFISGQRKVTVTLIRKKMMKIQFHVLKYDTKSLKQKGIVCRIASMNRGFKPILLQRKKP